MRDLNGVMVPLVGSSHEIREFHTVMAAAAVEPKMQLAAYTGEYLMIRPNTGELFDPRLHLDVVDEENRTAGRQIKLTAMPGIKFIRSGTERICAKAGVLLSS